MMQCGFKFNIARLSSTNSSDTIASRYYIEMSYIVYIAYIVYIVHMVYSINVILKGCKSAPHHWRHSSMCIQTLHRTHDYTFVWMNHREPNLFWMWINQLVCLLFYILETFKVISGRVPTCDRVHSWRFYSAAPLGNLNQSHYPDAEPNRPCRILIMPST